MRVLVSLLAASVVVGGCGREPARFDAIAHVRAATVTRASARLAIRTHHGANAISGLRIAGRCERGLLELSIGHAPPYEPLRDVGVTQIDRSRPPRRYPLHAICRHGRFDIRVRTLAVRFGRGALIVRGDRALWGTLPAVDVGMQAIE